MLDGKLYDHIDAIAIGPYLAPLWLMFLCFLENKYLNDCPSQLKPILYCRYVDDTACFFKDKNTIYFLFISW